MTTTTDLPAAAPLPALPGLPSADHRGSWIPAGRMVGARFTELRKRRGLMLMVLGVTIGIPTVFMAIRLILHAAAPHTYGPAGGYDAFVGMVAGVLYLFGFIVAATLGATAGSIDLTEGMFRHHVITGRSRIALYLARIPAGLALILPAVAAGFAVVCFVCVFAAPTSLSYAGVRIPAGLSEAQLVQWSESHGQEVLNNFPLSFSPSEQPAAGGCLPGGGPGGPGVFHKGPAVVSPGPQHAGSCTPAQLRAEAAQIARQDYPDYARLFLYPSTSLMVKTGLWIELEAIIGFMVGLGLASLLGQRTVAVVLMVVLEIIVTPIAARAHLPHLINLQRSVVGIATAHLEPGGLPTPFGGGPSDQSMFLHESTVAAVCVVVAWIVGWTALGMWRMATRDA
jgi:hypothetical protein